MANKILIIGVGSAGIIAVDKMNLPNSKKLFVDSDLHILHDVKSDGEKIGIVCPMNDQCPSFYCYDCIQDPIFFKDMLKGYEDEIRLKIMNAFEIEN